MGMEGGPNKGYQCKKCYCFDLKEEKKRRHDEEMALKYHREEAELMERRRQQEEVHSYIILTYTTCTFACNPTSTSYILHCCM